MPRRWQPLASGRRMERAAVEGGRSAQEIWPEKPAKARQKDNDARWTMKFSKAGPAADGSPQGDIAVPAFGYKSHISIDRRHGIIRRQRVTDAAAHAGAQLRKGLIDPKTTAADVWADTAYRSAANEQTLPIRLIPRRSSDSLDENPEIGGLVMGRIVSLGMRGGNLEGSSSVGRRATARVLLVLGGACKSGRSDGCVR